MLVLIGGWRTRTQVADAYLAVLACLLRPSLGRRVQDAGGRWALEYIARDVEVGMVRCQCFGRRCGQLMHCGTAIPRRSNLRAVSGLGLV